MPHQRFPVFNGGQFYAMVAKPIATGSAEPRDPGGQLTPTFSGTVSTNCAWPRTFVWFICHNHCPYNTNRCAKCEVCWTNQRRRKEFQSGGHKIPAQSTGKNFSCAPSKMEGHNGSLEGHNEFLKHWILRGSVLLFPLMALRIWEVDAVGR